MFKFSLSFLCLDRLCHVASHQCALNILSIVHPWANIVRWIDQSERALYLSCATIKKRNYVNQLNVNLPQDWRAEVPFKKRTQVISDHITGYHLQQTKCALNWHTLSCPAVSQILNLNAWSPTSIIFVIKAALGDTTRIKIQVLGKSENGKFRQRYNVHAVVCVCNWKNVSYQFFCSYYRGIT